jgi:hypothetical protein
LTHSSGASLLSLSHSSSFAIFAAINDSLLPH